MWFALMKPVKHLMPIFFLALLSACSGTPAASGKQVALSSKSSASSASVKSSASSSVSNSSTSSSISSISVSSSASSSSSKTSSSSASSVASSSSRSSSSSSSTSSSISSSASSGSSGSLDRASFSVLPALIDSSGASISEGTEWVNGESRLAKDNHGSGELFAFRWSELPAAKVHLVASADNGHTWRLISNAPTSSTGCVGQCSLFPGKILGLAQDASGKLHALMGANDYSNGGGTFREYYVRIKLTYDVSSKLSGYNLEAVVALPDHKRSVNVLSDLRGDIKIVDYAGQEALMYIVNATTISSQSTQDIKVFVGRALTLMPSSTSDFVGIANASGDTKVLDSCSYSMPNGNSYCTANPAFFSTHNITATFAQNRSTKDVYVFVGPIEADYGVANDPSGQPEATRLRAFRLAWNGAGWTLGSFTTIAMDNGSYLPLLFSAQSGMGSVWLMFLHPTNGIVFGRMDASGFTPVTNPVTAKNHNGWGVFSVSPDDTKIWAIWNICVVGGANSQTAQAYWNGSTWNIFSDSGISTGDNSGMGGVSGWSGGVAAILFRGTLLRPNPPIPMSAAISGQ